MVFPLTEIALNVEIEIDLQFQDRNFGQCIL